MCSSKPKPNLNPQRWSPRRQILKSLALASRPQVLENWPVLGSRTALFFGMLKFCGALEKFLGKRFFSGDRLKNFCEDLFFFFGEHLRFVSLVLGLGLEHSCPWPRECLSSERLSLALASDFFLCPWPWPRAFCPRLHLCEPLTKVRIYFSIFGCRWRWYTHNKSCDDHQQDQQFSPFFFWTKRVTTVKFEVNKPELNLNQKYFTKVNPNQT